jgi:NAD(P)-dependent dehydrogenase (short-subunit alcohol dehydrogenase family)
MSEKPLSGQTAFITGGSGGIGSSAAKFLLRDGAAVVLMGRSRETLDSARSALLERTPDGNVQIHVGDAGSAGDVRAGLQLAHDLQGGLNIVVPTVGGGGFMPLLMHDETSFMEQLELNILTAFLAIRYGVPMMKNGGSIVCVSSTAAVLPFPGLSSYCAAKGGLEQFIRTAADELSTAHVRVNAVRPGITQTVGTGPMFAAPAIIEPFIEQIPLGRGGFADDIGQAIRYLAGPESGWVTGQSFAVDGGQELRRNPDLGPMLRHLFGDGVIDTVRSGQSPENADTKARDSSAMTSMAAPV